MIYSDDGYYLTYIASRNTIEIVMPQTTTTLRRTTLTEAEEIAILSVVKAIVERKTDEQAD